MYKIEKNIPIPNIKYPFAELEIGDSFYVEGGRNVTSAVRVAAFTFAKKTNTSFVTRTVENGVRIWRKK